MTKMKIIQGWNSFRHNIKKQSDGWRKNKHVLSSTSRDHGEQPRRIFSECVTIHHSGIIFCLTTKFFTSRMTSQNYSMTEIYEWRNDTRR